MRSRTLPDAGKSWDRKPHRPATADYRPRDRGWGAAPDRDDRIENEGGEYPSSCSLQALQGPLPESGQRNTAAGRYRDPHSSDIFILAMRQNPLQVRSRGRGRAHRSPGPIRLVHYKARRQISTCIGEIFERSNNTARGRRIYLVIWCRAASRPRGVSLRRPPPVPDDQSLALRVPDHPGSKVARPPEVLLKVRFTALPFRRRDHLRGEAGASSASRSRTPASGEPDGASRQRYRDPGRREGRRGKRRPTCSPSNRRSTHRRPGRPSSRRAQPAFRAPRSAGGGAAGDS